MAIALLKGPPNWMETAPSESMTFSGHVTFEEIGG